MNVSDVLLDVLYSYGVKHVFGVPGDAIDTIMESMRKQNKIGFTLVRHEETWAFAAAAMAKLTGELTCCMGTAGPGAIHLLNGLYDAKMDNAPVLAITGGANTPDRTQTSFQEINTVKLFDDVAGYNAAVVHPEQVHSVMHLACQHAIKNRTVAHINIPTNVSMQKVSTYTPYTFDYNLETLSSSPEAIQKAAALINKAKKPVMLIGHWSREATDELIQLSEHINAPIIHALRGKDIIKNHPNHMWWMWLLWTKASNKAMEWADLLLMIGTGFPYKNFLPNHKIPAIQIDIKINMMGLRYPVDVQLPWHAKTILAQLLPLLQENEYYDYVHYMNKFASHEQTQTAKVETSTDTPIRPQVVAKIAGEEAKDDAIFCVDTGAVTVRWARHLHLRDKQRFTISGRLASMAYGLPAAIGAQIAYPDRQVIAFCGDGGFAMLMGDFATCVKDNLPVNIIVFNNSKLGLIKLEQEVHGRPEYHTWLHNPDFKMFAQACGGEWFRVEKPEELQEAIQKAYASPKPTIIDVIINPNELTMPPAISFDQAVGFAKAKIKEFFWAGETDHGFSALKH